MSKSHTNQYGFGTIEVALVVVVVVLLGAVGYIVYRNHNKATTQSTTTTDTTTTRSTTSTTATTTPAQPANPYAGWKTFTSSVGKFSVKYPAGWTYTDATANSNEDQSFSLQSTDKDYGYFFLTFDILRSSQLSGQYQANTGIQTLSNGLRVWTDKWQWTSKHYNNLQPFDCARLRLLDKSVNKDVALPTSEYLNSDGGFCFAQDSFTTKSYQEQLASQEYQDAIKIYSSIKINN